jgi:hypothetical protein
MHTVFFSKAGLLYAFYMLVDTGKKRVFRGGEILGVESLPKWQTDFGPNIMMLKIEIRSQLKYN